MKTMDNVQSETTKYTKPISANPEGSKTDTKEYGCVKCQRTHREDEEPGLFSLHILHQSKHGWYWVRSHFNPSQLARELDLGSQNSQLPSVVGGMEMTHAAFQHACRVMLWELQENPNCDTHIVKLLCEAVRCSRECSVLARLSLKHSERMLAVKRLQEALRFYAQSKDWAECMSTSFFRLGEIEIHHGEPFMAFAKGEDQPWKIAADALKH